MFVSRCPYRGHETKMARIFLAPIGVTDSEGVKILGIFRFTHDAHEVTENV